jgi:hypothetical protein
MICHLVPEVWWGETYLNGAMKLSFLLKYESTLKKKVNCKYNFINFCCNVVFVMYQLHVSWQNANIPEHWYDIMFVILQQLHASCQN